MPPLLLFALLSIVLCPMSADVRTYAPTTVVDFIGSSLLPVVSDRCAARLSSVGRSLSGDNVTRALLFVDSFGSGAHADYVNRDHDRWVYKGLQCLGAADEQVLVRSSTPTSFCLGYSLHKSTVYSVCLPDVCHQHHRAVIDEWRKRLDEGQRTLVEVDNETTTTVDEKGRTGRISVRQPLDYLFCIRSRMQKQWFQRPFALAEFTFNLLLLAVVVVATVFDYRRRASLQKLTNTADRLLLAFSMRQNTVKLIGLPKEVTSTIGCFFGLRFLSMAWTVTGHSYLFYQVFVDNVDEYKSGMTDNFFNQWISNFTLSVDTFFVLSATLTAYSWFNKMNKMAPEKQPGCHDWSYWLDFYRHRVVRLWPAYAFTVLSVSTRLSISHYHSMWPPTDPAVQCQQRWWQNLLFLNSLFENRCLPWLWYIGTEFIFYVLSPIFLLALRYRPIFGLSLSLATILCSNSLRALMMHIYNYPPTEMLFVQPAIFNADYVDHHFAVYVKPYTRIASYLVGLLLGHHLAGCRQGSSTLSVGAQMAGWTSATLAGVWAVFGFYPAVQGWAWPVYHLVYGSMHRTVFALAVGWLVFACHTGIAGPINRLLSHRALIPLANLCYGCYLFHMMPIILTYLLAGFPQHWTGHWPILVQCVVQLVISYAAAYILAMFVELPALNIERIWLDRRQCRVPKTQSEVPLRGNKESTIDNTGDLVVNGFV